jgi:hypothetical protein
MTSLLAAEWLKMRTRLMPRVLTLIMVALIAFAFWDMDTNLRNLILPRAWLAALYFASTFSIVLWPILGGCWAGNEYGWGIVRLTLSRRPDRVQWVLSAMSILVLVAGLVVVATLVVGTIAGIIVAAPTGHNLMLTDGLQADYGLILLKSGGAAWLVIVFYTLVAYAAGSIFRSASVGVGAGLDAWHDMCRRPSREKGGRLWKVESNCSDTPFIPCSSRSPSGFWRPLYCSMRSITSKM